MFDERKRREQRVKSRIKALGLHVEPFGGNGAVRIFGPGVYLLAARLSDLWTTDLKPAHRYTPSGDSTLSEPNGHQ